MTSSDQENFLEDLYDQLDDDTFLGNSFEDEDNLFVLAIAPELSSSSSDNDDGVIDELELDDADNVVEEPRVPSLSWKQGFANLNEVITKILTEFPLKNMQPFGILIRTNQT